MSSRYVAITLEQFTQLMSKMDFEMVKVEGTLEYVFERFVAPRNPAKYPNHALNRYVVRIYSSIDVRTKVSRETAADAIRVVLFDQLLGKKERGFARVYRTISALENTEKRVREAFRIVLDRDPDVICERCSSVMVERKFVRAGKTEKFLGCSAWRKDDKNSCRGRRSLSCTPATATVSA